MIIQNIDGVGGSLDIAVTDKSYRLRQIMGEDSLYLYFTYEIFVSVAVGAYVDYQGVTYYLLKPDNFKKNHSRNYEYSLILDSSLGNLSKYKMRDSAEKLLKFPFTAKPQQHLQMLVDNLNDRESGWTVGSCIDATEKLISYNHTNLREALQMIAEAFETEWEVQGKTINLKKVEYNQSSPLALSYGKGNGFKPGIGRSNVDEKAAIEVLHIQGGERNIDYSKYGNKALLLPKSQTYIYEGREYIVSADGRSIQRNDKALVTGVEDSLDCSHIYPSRVGSVSELIVVDATNHFYDFKDASIPEDLDFNDCLMEGETMTVVFQSGMLAGREFEIDSYVHADRLFRIVPQEQDGLLLPDDTFKPALNDEYAVFGIQLPDVYIRDDVSEEGASWDMFKEAVQYFYENETPRFTFSGELDGIWAKQDWINIGGKIVLGGFVNFSDPNFFPAGELIRITEIKDYVNNPYSPEIELSNVVTGSTIVSEIGKVKAAEVVETENHKQAISFTKRRFRSAQETMALLSDAIDGFGKGINPITVQTMALLVGDQSLQFRFVNGNTDPVEVTHNIAFNSTSKILNADAGWIQHMTLGITEVKAGSREDSEYSFWNVSSFASPALVETDKAYYFYVKASKTDSTAVFYLSETAIKLEEVTGYYHFLIGILNTEVDDERTFAQLYGFTEILPGQISTSKITADSINVTEAFATQIYSSGAKIGGVDINPAAITENGIEGLRLGNLVTFNPTEGYEGIMLGKHDNKYKVFIGNETQNIVFDGSQLLLSGYPMIGTGESVGVGELSNYFEIINKGQANQYLRAKISFASTGEVTAYAAGADIPTIWDSMPIAGADLLGGVKIGENLTIDEYGVLSAQAGGVSSWNDLTDVPLTFTPSAHTHTRANITDFAHSHTVSEISDIASNYLGINAKAADSEKLDGLDSSQFVRSDATDTISGLISFSRSVEEQFRVGYNQTNINPYIQFYEGTTARARIGYSTASNFIFLANAETGEELYISSGLNGLIYRADGTQYNIWHSGNDEELTHKSSDETITGAWTFSTTLTADNLVITNAGQGVSAPNGWLHLNRFIDNPIVVGNNSSANLYVVNKMSIGKTTNAGYALDVAGTINASTQIIASSTAPSAIRSSGGYDIDTGSGKGLRFWTSDNYKIYMSAYNDGTWGGGLTSDGDYHMYFRMAGAGRGFAFANTNYGNILHIDNNGILTGSNGRYRRIAHNKGHLEGSFNNVGDNHACTNPIYTIGYNFNPSVNTLGDMYGIGYTESSYASFLSSFTSKGWGLYIAAGGSARIFLNGNQGDIEAKGSAIANTLVCNQTSGTDTSSGLSLYSTYASATTYGIQFMKTSTYGYGTHGSVTGDWAMYFNMNNSSGRGWIFRTTDLGNKLSISESGNLVASGEITAFSDRRLKSNLNAIDNPLIKIKQLTGYTYDKDNRRCAGLIAQDVKAVLPEAVHGEETPTTYLSINTAGVMGLVIEGIKAVNIKAESLEKRISRLERENKELRQQLKLI